MTLPKVHSTQVHGTQVHGTQVHGTQVHGTKVHGTKVQPDRPDTPDEILDAVTGPFERAHGRARPR
jgi:hypothetical protein